MIANRGFLSAADLSLTLGTLPHGPRNAITDVPGILVGHETVTSECQSVQTGVTVVVPHGGNVFREKVVAACHVINGFGKTTGLVQVIELGQLEAPIALTNTLSIPAVTEGLLDHLLDSNPDLVSVNTVVAECNDSGLNDIRGRHVRREHVANALATATSGPVQQGAIGAGRGMSAFGLKGGIGTASRRVYSESGEAMVGVLVLSNFCRLRDLVIVGRPVGLWLAEERPQSVHRSDHGSIIIILATDAPVSERQLARLLRRVQNGLARTGSSSAHYSGEIAIGFTTAGRIHHADDIYSRQTAVLSEETAVLDPLFQAVTEGTEEAVLNSLFNAETVVGNAGARCEGFPTERLADLLDRPLNPTQ